MGADRVSGAVRGDPVWHKGRVSVVLAGNGLAAAPTRSTLSSTITAPTSEPTATLTWSTMTARPSGAESRPGRNRANMRHGWRASTPASSTSSTRSRSSTPTTRSTQARPSSRRRSKRPPVESTSPQHQHGWRKPVARITYAAARARAANGLELGLRVATAIRKENDHPPGRLDKHQRAQVIVERGTYSDPGEASPPPARRSAPPVRPIGPRPWATRSSSPAQLGLDGTAQPLPPPPSPPPLPARQLGLELPAMSTSYHSPAWGGTVTQAPLVPSDPCPTSTEED
jgi:hypothetical protein